MRARPPEFAGQRQRRRRSTLAGTPCPGATEHYRAIYVLLIYSVPFLNRLSSRVLLSFHRVPSPRDGAAASFFSLGLRYLQHTPRTWPNESICRGHTNYRGGCWQRRRRRLLVLCVRMRVQDKRRWWLRRQHSARARARAAEHSHLGGAAGGNGGARTCPRRCRSPSSSARAASVLTACRSALK